MPGFYADKVILSQASKRFWLSLISSGQHNTEAPDWGEKSTPRATRCASTFGIHVPLATSCTEGQFLRRCAFLARDANSPNFCLQPPTPCSPLLVQGPWMLCRNSSARADFIRLELGHWEGYMVIYENEHAQICRIVTVWVSEFPEERTHAKLLRKAVHQFGRHI